MKEEVKKKKEGKHIKLLCFFKNLFNVTDLFIGQTQIKQLERSPTPASNPPPDKNLSIAAFPRVTVSPAPASLFVPNILFLIVHLIGLYT